MKTKKKIVTIEEFNKEISELKMSEDEAIRYVLEKTASFMPFTEEELEAQEAKKKDDEY